MAHLYKHKKGFTLIELMIVIAIIAILISFALPAYRNYITRTKIAEGSAMSASFKMSVNEAYTNIGTLTGLDNDAYGIGSSSVTGHCVNAINVADGEITVSYDCAAGSAAVADPDVLAAQLVFSPNIDATGTLQWSCTATVNRPDQSPCS